MTGFIFLRRCPRFSIFPRAILQPSLDKGDRTITANQIALLHLGILADGKIVKGEQIKNQISVSEGDSVWVVADGDVNYNNPDPITAKDSLLSKARKMADAKGIQIALSNPCFEFWYLLHFQYTTKFFKDYPQ